LVLTIYCVGPKGQKQGNYLRLNVHYERRSLPLLAKMSI